MDTYIFVIAKVWLLRLVTFLEHALAERLIVLATIDVACLLIFN